MDLRILLIYIFFFFVGIVVGILVTHRSKDGELQIDATNSEKDIYRLELGDNLQKLAKKKKIVLRVVHKNISQKKHTL